MRGAHGSLHVVLGEFQERADKQGEPKMIGSKVARFKPDAQGNLGQPEFVSELLAGKIILGNLTVDEPTATIYVSSYPIY